MSAADVLAQVKSTGIETVRLCFVDQHGILRGKTIVADALKGAFKDGIGAPSTLLLKDTAHRTVFPVWGTPEQTPFAGASDIIMQPDPARFFPLPWAPHSAILLCDVTQTDGTPIAFCSGEVLRYAIDQLSAAGYAATFGLEVEFQVFQRIDDALGHHEATIPSAPIKTQNLTQGHQFLTETRYSEAEPLLDDLRRMAEALGFEPRSMEIEMGPSQFEFTFAPSDPATQADRFVLFRTMVRELCHARGLHASFMAKPGLPNAAANGWHIHQSLQDQSGENLFRGDAVSDIAGGWIAGLLSHAPGACLMTNPSVNSYKRFTPFQLAPNAVLWGRDNRGAMVRALLNDTSAARIENRVPDTMANPFFAFAAQILSGLDGIKRGLKPPAPSENPYDPKAERLPETLGQAIAAFEACPLWQSTLGASFVQYLATLKRAEWDRYRTAVSQWEHQEYFGLM